MSHSTSKLFRFCFEKSFKLSQNCFKLFQIVSKLFWKKFQTFSKLFQINSNLFQIVWKLFWKKFHTVLNLIQNCSEKSFKFSQNCFKLFQNYFKLYKNHFKKFLILIWCCSKLFQNVSNLSQNASNLFQNVSKLFQNVSNLFWRVSNLVCSSWTVLRLATFCRWSRRPTQRQWTSSSTNATGKQSSLTLSSHLVRLKITVRLNIRLKKVAVKIAQNTPAMFIKNSNFFLEN